MSDRWLKAGAVFGVMACMVFAVACGGGGGGGGGTATAFLSGSVSYPSSAAKPSVSNAGEQGSFAAANLLISSTNQVPVEGATVSCYAVDDTTFSSPIATTTTDAGGDYSFTQIELGAFDDQPVVVRATFMSPVSETPVSIRNFVDLGTATAAERTSMTVDVLAEAITQQIIQVFAEFGITLDAAQFAAVSLIVDMITTSLQADIEAGGTITLNESALLESNTADAVDAVFVGQVEIVSSDASSGITSIETNFVGISTSISAVLKKVKVINFVTMMGFPVGTGTAGEVYTVLRPKFFPVDASGNPVALTGVVRAPALDDAGTARAFAPHVYLVTLGDVFVDANSNGTVDFDATFTQERKCRLMENLEDLPVLSNALMSEIAANLGEVVTVGTVVSAISSNFKWVKENVQISPDGNPIYQGDPVDLSDSEGGSAIDATFVLSQLAQTLAADPLTHATRFASEDFFIIDISDHVINEAQFLGFQADPAFDPFATIFSNISTTADLTNFVTDETLYVPGRSSIWEEERNFIKQALTAGFPPALWGTTLSGSTDVGFRGGMLLLMMTIERPYAIDSVKGFFSTVANDPADAAAGTHIEPAFANIKFMEPNVDVDTTPEMIVKNIFLAMVPGLTPATFVDSGILNTIYSYNFAICPLWIDGNVQDFDPIADVDPAVAVSVSFQTAEISNTTGIETLAANIVAELFEIDSATFMRTTTAPLQTQTSTAVDPADSTADAFILFTGLKAFTEYGINFHRQGESQGTIFHIFTDPSWARVRIPSTPPFTDLQFDDGWVPGDPTPRVEGDDRSWPVVLAPQGGTGAFESFPSIGLFAGDGVDFRLAGAAAGDPDTFGIFGPSLTGADLTFTFDTATGAGTLTTAAGVTIYDVDETALGITRGLPEASFAGGTTPIDTLNGYATTTAATSVTVQTTTFNETTGEPVASLYLILTGEQKGFDPLDPTTVETIGFLVEPFEITPDGFLFAEFGLVRSDGTVIRPAVNIATGGGTTAGGGGVALDVDGDPATIADSYFPMSAGIIRHFFSSDSFQGIITEEELLTEVIGTIDSFALPASGGTATPFDFYFPDRSDPSRVAEDKDLFSFDSLGNLVLNGWYEENDFGGTVEVEVEEYMPPILVAPANFNIGDFFSGSGTLYSYLGPNLAGIVFDTTEPYNFTTEIVEVIPNFTVPAGSFTDVLHLRIVINEPSPTDPLDSPETDIIDLFLARGVGTLVWAEEETEGGFTDEVWRDELVAYNIGAGPVGTLAGQFSAAELAIHYDPQVRTGAGPGGVDAGSDPFSLDEYKLSIFGDAMTLDSNAAVVFLSGPGGVSTSASFVFGLADLDPTFSGFLLTAAPVSGATYGFSFQDSGGTVLGTRSLTFNQVEVSQSLSFISPSAPMAVMSNPLTVTGAFLASDIADPLFWDWQISVEDSGGFRVFDLWGSVPMDGGTGDADGTVNGVITLSTTLTSVLATGTYFADIQIESGHGVETHIRREFSIP